VYIVEGPIVFVMLTLKASSSIFHLSPPFFRLNIESLWWERQPRYSGFAIANHDTKMTAGSIQHPEQLPHYYPYSPARKYGPNELVTFTVNTLSIPQNKPLRVAISRMDNEHRPLCAFDSLTFIIPAQHAITPYGPEASDYRNVGDVIMFEGNSSIRASNCIQFVT
jgi:hypothetical protein